MSDSAASLRCVGTCCIVLGVLGGVILPSSIAAIITGAILAECSPNAKEMKQRARCCAIAGIPFSVIECIVIFLITPSTSSMTTSLMLFFMPLGARASSSNAPCTSAARVRDA